MPLVATGRAQLVGRRAELASRRAAGRATERGGAIGAGGAMSRGSADPSLAELLDGARARGLRALSDRASEFERDVGYGGVDRRARRARDRSRPGGLDGLAIEHRRALGAVFPALAETDQVAPSPCVCAACCSRRSRRCWSSWPASGRSCSRSTICRGRGRRRSRPYCIWSSGRRARRSCSRWPIDRGSCRAGWRRRWRTRRPRRHPHGARPAQAAETRAS